MGRSGWHSVSKRALQSDGVLAVLYVRPCYSLMAIRMFNDKNNTRELYEIVTLFQQGFCRSHRMIQESLCSGSKTTIAQTRAT